MKGGHLYSFYLSGRLQAVSQYTTGSPMRMRRLHRVSSLIEPSINISPSPNYGAPISAKAIPSFSAMARSTEKNKNIAASTHRLMSFSLSFSHRDNITILDTWQ
jgi:hypothetical protein